MVFILDSSSDRVDFAHKDEGRLILGTRQRVDSIIEDNKKLQTLNDGYSPSREWKRVARIPMSVVREWCKQAGINFREFLRKPRAFEKWLDRKLQDPDNRFLLTAPMTRPQPKGIIGLDGVLAEGRKLGMREKTKWERFFESLLCRWSCLVEFLSFVRKSWR